MILILLFISEITIGQNKINEFEGKIYFQNSFDFDTTMFDSTTIKNGFGLSCIYSYKSGKCHWEIIDAECEYEIFDSENRIVVDKYHSNDSLILVDVYNIGYILKSYNISNEYTDICGYKCKSINLILVSEIDSSIINRTIYYSLELKINPNYFEGYKSFANEKVYNITKSTPLKIVTEFTSINVIVSMEAVKVEKTKIKDNLFEIDKKMISKKR